MKLPHATESVQWGDHLCFKVGGKLFCVMPLEPDSVRLSFKASPENFHSLQEIDGVIPAPYMARAQWLALRKLPVFPDLQMKELLRESHSLVFNSLTRKLRAELESAEKKKKTPKPKKAAKSVRAK